MNTVVQSEEFAVSLKGLKDPVAKAKIIVRLKRLVEGNIGDAKHFEGISEMRVDYGPGYRVYFAKQGTTIYLLLNGGDKSTQKRDIEKAKKLLVKK
jgi:putative addiction module killer protein